MPRLEAIFKNYNYDLPEGLIAQKPASPRDSAKLLVYSRAQKSFAVDTFKNLSLYLPKGAVLVMNETKVIPARFVAAKPTGGKVELLFVDREKNTIRCMANRALQSGMALRAGGRAIFAVVAQEGKYYRLKPSFSTARMEQFLMRYGVTPIPPYIKYSPLSERELRREYQAIFAKHPGSIAAPTASLHFTARLLSELKKKGFGMEFVTLNVGLGTFAPLREEHFLKNALHAERYAIAPATLRRLNAAKRAGRPIVAVGTTVVRTLESAANAHGVLSRASGDTKLFIREGYRFRFVDGMITNFHVPQSSLLMLVAAFMGRREVLRAYDYAKTNAFRFFSFGDGMLII